MLHTYVAQTYFRAYEMLTPDAASSFAVHVHGKACAHDPSSRMIIHKQFAQVITAATCISCTYQMGCKWLVAAPFDCHSMLQLSPHPVISVNPTAYMLRQRSQSTTSSIFWMPTGWTAQAITSMSLSASASSQLSILSKISRAFSPLGRACRPCPPPQKLQAQLGPPSEGSACLQTCCMRGQDICMGRAGWMTTLLLLHALHSSAVCGTAGEPSGTTGLQGHALS